MEDEKSRLMIVKTTSAVASQQTIFRSRTAPHTQAQDTDGIDPSVSSVSVVPWERVISSHLLALSVFFLLVLLVLLKFPRKKSRWEAQFEFCFEASNSTRPCGRA